MDPRMNFTATDRFFSKKLRVVPCPVSK